MTFPWIRKIILFIGVGSITLLLAAVCIRAGLGFFFPPFQVITDSEAPVGEKTVTSPVTVVNLPLSIPINSLTQAAEKYVPLDYTDIDEDPTDLLVDDNLTYRLKRGPIEMAINGNGIRFSFPVSGTVKMEGKVNLGVAKIDSRAHGEVEGVISGSIAFKILSDWRIEPDLHFNVEISKAAIPVKRLGKISLRSFLENRLTSKIKRKKKKLTAKVMDKNIIRNKVLKVWGEMHRADLLNDTPKVWARVVPVNVGFMSVTGDGSNTLHTGLRLTLETALFIQEDQPVVEVTNLPNAQILKKIPDSFILHVPFQVESVTLNRYLEEKVIGTPREVAQNVSVTVKRAEVISSGENRLSAILFADVHHTRLGLLTNCRFYINGTVTHNASNNEIRFTNIDYDASFSRWWVSALHWTASPFLLHQLEKRLMLPIDTQLKKAHNKLTEEIEKLVIPQGIKADLSVNPPRVISPGVNREGFFGELQLDGRLGARLDFKITPFKKK